MARLARVVAPGYPHHIIQRGNRRQQTFFSDNDYLAYIELMAEWCNRCSVEIWCYCLMPNHTHLIAVPAEKDSLASAIGEAHRRYARMVNFREGWRGYFWQGRFSSFIMDDNYLLAATRYIELNPVKAKLVNDPYDYRWSSYRAHLEGKDDRLVKVNPLLTRINNWKNFIQEPVSDIKIENILKHERTGRPLGDEEFIRKLESETGRNLKKKKPGPKGPRINTKPDISAREVRMKFDFLKDLDKDIRKSLIKQLRDLWTYNSVAIEGNTLTLGETAFVIEDGLTIAGKPLRDHQEVVGHSTAIELIYDLLTKKGLISKENLFDLHKAVQSQIVVDEYKQAGNWKQESNGTNATIEDKQIFIEYTPPEQTHKFMDIWLSFLNEKMKSTKSKNDAVKAYAKLHLSFVSIHPFFDGNGRMARLLSNLPVIKAGFPPIIISKTDRFEYITCLAEYQVKAGQINQENPILVDNKYFDDFLKFCKKSWSSSMELVDQAFINQQKRAE